MKYQFVIQFSDDSLQTLDLMVALEDEFIELIGGPSVDGHDIGSGEANIFLNSDNPKKTFAIVKPVLKRFEQLKKIKVAYRDFAEDNYTVLWPLNFKGSFKVL